MMKKKYFPFLTSCLMLASCVSAKIPEPSNSNLEDAEDIQTLQQTSRAFSSVAKKATPAVVYIESQVAKTNFQENPLNFFNDDFFQRFFGLPPQKDMRQQRPMQTVRGSGFIVAQDGYILTNNHVIENAESISVTLMDGKKLTAQLIGTDPRSDLAVIKIEGSQYPYLEFGEPSKLEVGEWVIAIGNPFGLEATVTVGVVSAIGRNQLQLAEYENWIQTDAAINPGNSGGPLLNIYGKVVGVNTAIMSASGGYMGIGFAMPVDMADPIMQQLIQKGSVTRGFLGILMQPIDSSLAESFGLSDSHGAIVTDVVKDSPADMAGIKQGDVLLQFNNKKIHNPSSFRNEVALMPPGSELDLVIFREGQKEHIVVALGTTPDKEQSVSNEPLQKLGLEITDLNSEIANRLGYSLESGALITRVQPGSAAEQLGIRNSGLIVRVGDQTVHSVNDVKKALKAYSGHRAVRLLIRQGPLYRYVVLPFDNTK